MVHLETVSKKEGHLFANKPQSFTFNGLSVDQFLIAGTKEYYWESRFMLAMVAREVPTLDDDSSWFVVYTKPRAEVYAEENLMRQSFTTYLPLIKEMGLYKGRLKEMIGPLFPRYLFIRLAPGVQDISPVRSTRGVTSLVSFGGQLAVMPNGMVEALRACEEPKSGARTIDRALFNKGDRIRIEQGAFAGLEGVFEVSTSEERVIVLLNILGREASQVTLPLSDIRPLL